MKKIFLGFPIIVCSVLSFSSNAEGDLNQPIEKKSLTQYALTWEEGQNHERYSFIPGLESGLFQTLIDKESRGPDWKKKAEEYIEKKFDIDELSSNWTERTELEVGDCGSNNANDLQDILDSLEAAHSFSWTAVKEKNGSKKTLIYSVTHITNIYLPNKNKPCLLIDEASYLFLNNKNHENEDLNYLGIRVGRTRVPKSIQK